MVNATRFYTVYYDVKGPHLIHNNADFLKYKVSYLTELCVCSLLASRTVEVNSQDIFFSFHYQEPFYWEYYEGKIMLPFFLVFFLHFCRLYFHFFFILLPCNVVEVLIIHFFFAIGIMSSLEIRLKFSNTSIDYNLGNTA